MDNRDAVPVHDPQLVILAGQLLESLDEFSTDIAEQIRARVDFYAGTSEVSAEELRRSCRANAEFVLRSMREDVTVWDIADLLRLPRQGPFVVVAAESPQLAQEALPYTENRLRIRGIRSAWRLLPEMQVGIVCLPGGGQLRQLVEELTGSARSRVGVSPSYAALTETASALRFARIAMASTMPGTAYVSLFDDHPLAVAAVGAPDAMRRIGQAVLGGVLKLPPEQSTLLLHTLAVWRDNGGSATATARKLFCHPNTVRQRLRKLESCTGRSLTDPQATAELLLALQAIHLLS